MLSRWERRGRHRRAGGPSPARALACDMHPVSVCKTVLVSPVSIQCVCWDRGLVNMCSSLAFFQVSQCLEIKQNRLADLFHLLEKYPRYTTGGEARFSFLSVSGAWSFHLPWYPIWTFPIRCLRSCPVLLREDYCVLRVPPS